MRKYLLPAVLLSLLWTQVSYAAVYTIGSGEDYETIKLAMDWVWTGGATGDSLEVRADTPGGTKVFVEDGINGRGTTVEDVTIYGREGDTIYWDSGAAGGHYQANTPSGTNDGWTFKNLNFIDSTPATGSSAFFLRDGFNWRIEDCTFQGVKLAINITEECDNVTIVNCEFLTGHATATGNYAYIQTTADTDVLIEGCTFTETSLMAGKNALTRHSGLTPAGGSVTYKNNTFNSTSEELKNGYVFLDGELANITFEGNNFYSGLSKNGVAGTACINITPNTATDQVVGFYAFNNYFHSMSDQQHGIDFRQYISGGVARAIAEYSTNVEIVGNTYEGFGVNTNTTSGFRLHEIDGGIFKHNKVSNLTGASGDGLRIVGVNDLLVEENLFVEIDNCILIHGENAYVVETTTLQAHVDNIMFRRNWFRGDASDGAFNIDHNDSQEDPDEEVDSANGLSFDRNVYQDVGKVAIIWHYTEAQTSSGAVNPEEFATLLQDTSTPVVNTVPDLLPNNDLLSADADRSFYENVGALRSGGGSKIMGVIRR